MSVPEWVQDSVFYQIFPDRFYNGNINNDPVNVQPWGSEPTTRGFQGGDIQGIIQKFDYLLDLGINAIYLNPIFSSATNHGYHTDDYYKIHKHFGTSQDFNNLRNLANSSNVKLILDGVFNHTGRGFFAFSDILENSADSPYLDWYHINKFPLDAFGEGEAKSYKAWWNLKPLPKLNTDNPKVRQYIFDVARYWIEQGIDGWRLDVPAEIDDDGFWEEFRNVVKSINPEAYILGEVWEADPRWVNDTHFDGLMHYPVRNAIMELLGHEGSISEFAKTIESFLSMYSPENLKAMYVPLSTHDTRRLHTKLEGNIEKIKLALLIQFASPGAPAIYYGDEIGLKGDKDPQSRHAFPWDENAWNIDLRNYVKTLIKIRKQYLSLRRGEMIFVFVHEGHCIYAFARTINEEKTLIVINSGAGSQKVDIPVISLSWNDGEEVQNLLSNELYSVKKGLLELYLPAYNGVMIA
ncbi:MAG: glycoside hydrolase family 13 protein [Chloroflexota bacterium]